MARHDPVQRVHQPRRSHDPQGSAERAGQPDLGQEGNAPTDVPGKQAPVGKEEPPALAARILGHGREHAAGFLVGQREQRQLFVPVDHGDDPRRPPAELSAPRIEQHRARERKRELHRRLFGHSRDYATPCVCRFVTVPTLGQHPLRREELSGCDSCPQLAARAFADIDVTARSVT